MSLKAELKALQNRLEAGRAPEVVAQMRRAVEELRPPEILGRVLKVGDRAPDFTLTNATGVPVDSRQLLAVGPLVVTFYRGRW
jgi:hypothetical protein